MWNKFIKIDFYSLQERIQNLGLEQCWQLLQLCLLKDASLIFDILLVPESNPAAAPPPPVAGQPTWCVCQGCREMPTDLERKCCGQPPEYYIANLPYMDLYIIDEGVLRLSRRIWNYVSSTQDLPDPGEILKSIQMCCPPAVCGVAVWCTGPRATGWWFRVMTIHRLHPK